MSVTKGIAEKAINNIVAELLKTPRESSLTNNELSAVLKKHIKAAYLEFPVSQKKRTLSSLVSYFTSR